VSSLADNCAVRSYNGSVMPPARKPDAGACRRVPRPVRLLFGGYNSPAALFCLVLRCRLFVYLFSLSMTVTVEAVYENCVLKRHSRMRSRRSFPIDSDQQVATMTL
jgi:hypothetical protein